MDLMDLTIEVSIPQSTDIEVVADVVEVTGDASGPEVVIVPTPGPPGAGSHIHTQTTPSAVWDVTHGLGQMLVEAAAVYNLDYTEQYTGVIVEPLTTTTCRLFFGSPASGRALIQG